MTIVYSVGEVIRRTFRAVTLSVARVAKLSCSDSMLATMSIISIGSNSDLTWPAEGHQCSLSLCAVYSHVVDLARARKAVRCRWFVFCVSIELIKVLIRYILWQDPMQAIARSLNLPSTLDVLSFGPRETARNIRKEYCQ
jgi:hypothetical protein